VSGRWRVVQGGASQVINNHVRVPGQRPRALVRAGPRGTRGGPGHGCAARLACGQAVFAPCDGTVATVRDGLARPGARDLGPSPPAAAKS
jgi:hypothetical protein